MKWPAQQHKWIFGAICAGLWITFSGTQLIHLDTRGSSNKTIVVAYPRISPTLAALEDAVKLQLAPSHQRIITNERLLAGRSFFPLLDRFILKPVQDEQLQILKIVSQIPLGGRLPGLNNKLEHKELKNTGTSNNTNESLRGMIVRNELSIPVQLLSSQQVAPIQPGPTTLLADANKIYREVQSETSSAMTLSQRAQHLISKESALAPSQQPVKYDGRVLVASQAAVAMASQKASISGQGPVEKPNLLSLVSPPKPSEGTGLPAVISGSIRLAGGLALTDPRDYLVIYREWQGLNLERAHVWLEDGRFEISAKSKIGKLIAQFKDAKGNTLGEGSLDLNALSLKNGESRIDGVNLVLKPVVSGSKIEVVSAHSYGEHVQTVNDAQVWIQGEVQGLTGDSEHRQFSEDSIKRNSNYIVSVQAKNHWGTLLIGSSGQENRALLFPNKLISAFHNLTIGEQRGASQYSGVVWGRITHNGRPVTGAQVEMAGDHRLQASYFNSLLLPDRFAESTGENGTFAFPSVTPGIQSLRVIYQGQVWPAQIIPVEVNFVSYLELELGQPESVPLEIFDPFDPGKELNGMLRWAGDETSETMLQGRGHIGIPTGPGVVMLEADAGEQYELMRYTVPRETKSLRMPVVRRDWLQNLVARKRVNLDTGVGIVVGLGVSSEFTVRIDEARDSNSKPEVVYFNAQGQALYTDEGQVGGGFVIFNVPPGLRTLTLQTNEDSKLFKQVMLSSPDAVNMLVGE